MRPAARQLRGGGRQAPSPPPPRGPGLTGEGRRLGSLPRGAEPARSSAGGASFPRPLRLAPLFSPGPLRPAAEPRLPLRSAWGCAPGTQRLGRVGTLTAGLRSSALPGKSACPGAPGGESAEGQRGARSLRLSSEPCAPRLGAHCRLPSPALHLFPFLLHISPSFPIFLPLDFSSPCLLSSCLPPLPLPSLSCSVFLHLLFVFAFSFLYLSFLSCLSLFLFALSFPSPMPPLASPIPFPLSGFPLLYPFSSLSPASLSVPGAPPASLFPREGKDCQVCVCSGGGGAVATAT